MSQRPPAAAAVFALCGQSVTLPLQRLPPDVSTGDVAALKGYRAASLVLAVVTLGLGLALLVVTAAEGGGVVGFLLGAVFVATGAGRLYAERRR